MFITRSQTSRLLAVIVFAGALTQSPLAMAATALVPIVANAHGVKEALWSTEVRLINRTDATKRLSVIDWIGTPEWRTTTYEVAGHATQSVGGWDFFGGPQTPGVSVVGIAVCDADDGLLVQTAVLAGLWQGGSLIEPCPGYEGGGPMCLGPAGAGPVLDGLAFTPSGSDTFVPWLHTDESRRANLVLVNPDNVTAHITLSIASQDGLTVQPANYAIPPRAILQLNDLFQQDPWTVIRAANRVAHAAGATATTRSDTRLLVLAYVISNDNNSLTVSVPR